MHYSNYQSSIPNWQIELANAVSEPQELFRLLEIEPSALGKIWEVIQKFPLRVPRSFIARMEKGNSEDPLLLQVLPTANELAIFPGYVKAPLEEQRFNPVSGLLHKYRDRALLLLTGACAINCRYCFRQYFPYEENVPGKQGWNKVISYLEKNSAIKEVIFSGGDPLILKDAFLAELIHKISAITHVQRLRLHTRLPIVLPQRITPELLQVLTATHLKLVMVMHINHANEIDHSVGTALRLLQAAGITLFNQSVLLKKINDSVETLVNLSEKLFANGILPYYLHLLDKVQGAMHFDVCEDKAKYLVQQMMQQLPGYLVPKLVREQPGALSKIPVAIHFENNK